MKTKKLWQFQLVYMHPLTEFLDDKKGMRNKMMTLSKCSKLILALVLTFCAILVPFRIFGTGHRSINDQLSMEPFLKIFFSPFWEHFVQIWHCSYWEYLGRGFGVLMNSCQWRFQMSSIALHTFLHLRCCIAELPKGLFSQAR